MALHAGFCGWAVLAEASAPKCESTMADWLSIKNFTVTLQCLGGLGSNHRVFGHIVDVQVLQMATKQRMAHRMD